jgi:hypothetical protein
VRSIACTPAGVGEPAGTLSVMWTMGTATAVMGLLIGAVPPVAAPSPSPAMPQSVSSVGTPVCRITDPRVVEVSGLVATATGYVVINDSSPVPSGEKIFFLDRDCVVVNVVNYPISARDPEDLAIDDHGTLWVADIGDNSTRSGGSGDRRTTIAVWSLAPGSKRPVIHRLAYPDGKPRDAETMLVSGDGTIVIVTKQPAGEVYTPDGPLRADNTAGVRLKQVGTFTPAATGTSNPYGFLGAALITGGAVAPDGTKAVLRTMSDAYEFDLTNGDVVAAITSGTYRITALPDEPQGEAIAYTPDSAAYLTASDQPGPSTIQRHQPAARTSTVAAQAPTSVAPAATAPTRRADAERNLVMLSAAGGLTGMLLIVAAIVGIRRSRHR